MIAGDYKKVCPTCDTYFSCKSECYRIGKARMINTCPLVNELVKVGMGKERYVNIGR